MSPPNGFAIWLTGLPAAGKTTLAVALATTLQQQGTPVQILDSDELREVLTPQPSYTPEEREWFYRTMVYIGQLLVQNGANVIFAATANRRRYRDRARKAMARFVEVYVSCSLEVCMNRDRKGIYEKARAGEATTVPGVQIPYEPPQEPALVVDSEHETAVEGSRRIMNWLEANAFI